MQRISVIGTSGSGKTTLARALAEKLDLKHIELDALHWGPDWTPAEKDVFRERVQNAVAGERWCVCGNYGSARDLIQARADTIVWLDYSFAVTFGRVLKRTARRAFTREELWAGNRERLTKQLFSKDSILLWVITTWQRRRREYPAMLDDLSRAGKSTVRLRTPAETRKWLESID